MNTDTQIAKTIWQQIDLGAKMGCGAREPIAIENGLLITVLNGRKKIRITLTSMDDYTVELIKINNNYKPTPFTILETHTGIYCDMLSDCIYHACNK